jgi:glutamate synthase (ferredoxin)
MEVRELMAQLGFRTVNEMVGRADRLEIKRAVDHWKAKGLDFGRVFYQPRPAADAERYCQMAQNHGIEESMDYQMLLRLCEPALAKRQPVRAILPISNNNRVVGTMLGSEVTRRHGVEGLPEDTIKLHFKGSAGQSFGAFMPKGITFELEGDANDYVGKGLSGAKIAVFPPKAATFKPQENIIIGNVALYGATSGELYICGVAGERFGVRNSGATAVVEGIGDHGCEYMTGGAIVVLGQVGRNFAAGMSGGVAYVLDEGSNFKVTCNKEMISFLAPEAGDLAEVRRLIENHVRLTRSPRGREVLDRWDELAPKFIKVLPNDYARVLAAMKKVKEAGLTGDEAVMAAFEENIRDTARVGGG